MAPGRGWWTRTMLVWAGQPSYLQQSSKLLLVRDLHLKFCGCRVSELPAVLWVHGCFSYGAVHVSSCLSCHHCAVAVGLAFDVCQVTHHVVSCRVMPLAGRVHQLKQKHLKLMLQQGAVPLRDGVRQASTRCILQGSRGCATRVASIGVCGNSFFSYAFLLLRCSPYCSDSDSDSDRNPKPCEMGSTCLCRQHQHPQLSSLACFCCCR